VAIVRSVALTSVTGRLHGPEAGVKGPRTTVTGMELRLLGAVEVVEGGRVVPLTRTKERALLAALALRVGEVVSEGRLCDALWGEDLPTSAAKALQTHVSRLRKTLGVVGVEIETHPGGYRLAPGAFDLDVTRANDLLAQARAACPEDAVALLREAGNLWRGPSLGELAGEPFAVGEAARLDELRVVIAEEHVEADLALGHHARVIAELEALCAEHPLRERLWAARMLALARDGRQAEALRVFQELRAHLGEDLGLEPSVELRDLDAAIAREDPSLVWAGEGSVATTSSPVALPSGVVTFLMTDIERSTALWEQDPTRMSEALARHDTIVADAIAAHGGVLLKTRGEGDSTFSVFAAVSEAAIAVIELQAALESESWPEAMKLRVRAALHTGEAELRDGDYYGPTVNRAARLRAVGYGGQILCSQASAQLLVDRLPEGASLKSLGPHRLQDLARPETVFQLGHAALASEFPPLQSLEALPNNLPVQLTSFVGREREVGVVTEALRSTRLVTITGTGGVGKTRLALQAAADALTDYPDGGWFCELAAAADADAMLQLVALALGLAPRQGMSMAEGIAEFIGKRQLLIVLDNCEHLLDAAADLVETVLATSPNVRVLATSREPLDVSGERVVRLRSLGVPRTGTSLEELTASDAVRLFIERAEAAGAEMVIDAENAAAIAEICRRLDGIPLAIELAAARVIALSPAEIAARLDERFRLLTGGRRAAVERHHTLRAAVDWSYSLLSETEQQVFDRLGVFSGTFDAAAAGAVAGGDGIEDWDILDTLTSLVAKSMLVVDRDAAATRYQMLETLRHYARERLDAAGFADERRRDHAGHFVGVAEASNQGLKSDDEPIWLERILADLDNYRAAVSWGLDSPGDEDGELAVRIIANLAYHGGWSGIGIGAWAEAAVERTRSADQRYRGIVLACAATNAFYRGDFATGRQLSSEAVQAGVVADSPFPFMIYSAAALFARPEELSDLLVVGLKSLEDAHAPEWDVAGLHASLAGMAAFAGELELAEAETTAGLMMGRHLNSPSIITTALYAHALACSRSAPAAALAALDEYFRIVRGGMGSQVIVRCRALKAQLRADANDLPGALDDLREAIDDAHGTGDRPAMAFTLARAVLVLRGGDPERAAVLSGVIGEGLLSRQFPILAWERESFQAVNDELKAALGPEHYQVAVETGKALSYDNARAAASEAIERLSPGSLQTSIRHADPA
jgi:predicted ATPase/DNA-binding SARP family transcriptional activator